MPSVNTRVFYSKTGRAKYISHLDLNHCIQRAIMRTKLPVWQTQGFNPHMYISFALPLSLGQEGLHEAFDFRTTEDISFDEIAQRLNNALPVDIRVTEVTEPIRKGTEISSAEYLIESDIDLDKFRSFLQREQIIVEKTTKKGTVTIDIKPHINLISMDSSGIIVRFPCGNEFSINPELLLSAYSSSENIEIKSLRIIRTHTFCTDGSEFR
ncbi:MAG: TIGR03936 family radical SAM-associated protein [Oscillospiraceae bacterium]